MQSLCTTVHAVSPVRASFPNWERSFADDPSDMRVSTSQFAASIKMSMSHQPDAFGFVAVMMLM
jgi:hypothetical protein